MAESPSRPLTVACVGSSSAAGRGQAFDWISQLKRRPGNGRLQFLHFGAGGDLAYHVRLRLPAVLACRPDLAVVWVGGNDALALASPRALRCLRLFKRLPRVPSLDWFRANLQDIVRQLKPAAVALCSLPPMGEDLKPVAPFQLELNRQIEAVSLAIKTIAQAEGVHYVPVYETLRAHIRAAPGRALTAFRLLPLYRDAWRVWVLRRSLEQLSRANGWRFHTDGFHLNSRGGLIVSDLVQEIIDQAQPRRGRPRFG